MFEVKAIIRHQRLDAVRAALQTIADMPGVTVSMVHAFSRQHGRDAMPSEAAPETDLLKLETVVPVAIADQVIDAIQQAATTGRAGDGMVFKIAVADAVRVRTGERGVGSL
jgi:nitrogen regulatory protein PII